jgi:radical SAM protein with 4Fe4S-binding SPASM domain
MQNVKPSPELYWFATNKCNLRCIYCCYDSTPEGSDELSTAEAKELIRQVAEFSKYFVIIGGEPLLREDLFELLDYARSLSLSCSIITKGTSGNRKWVEKMAEKGVKVDIALDALTPEVCDLLSQSERTYEKTRETIDRCLSAGILQGITSALMKPNAEETLDLLEFAAGLGVEGCWMSLRPIGRGVNIYRDLALTGVEYEEYLHRFYHRADEIKKKTGLSFYVYDPIYSRVLCQHGNNAYKICRIGDYLSVAANGDVIPCLFAGLKLGNIREKKIEEIWSEVISNRFFKEIHDPNRLKGACGECTYSFVCGGCRARAYQLTGDWFASDPACVYTSGVSPFTVRGYGFINNSS